MELETQLEVVRKRIQELEVGFSRTDAVHSGDEFSDLESEDKSLEFGSPGKSRRLDSPSESSISEASSLRSKLTESLKALSPSFSPERRRLERTLQAAAKGSCLDQEVSVSGEEWLSFKLDRENGEPRSLKVGDREGEELRPERFLETPEHAEKGALATSHGSVSAPGPAVMQLYKKQLLGTSRKEGSTGNALEDFRESLKVLERLERKEVPVKEYMNQRMEETVQERNISPRVESGKLEDVNAVRGFISSGWSFLNAEAKRNEAEQNTEGLKLKQEVVRRITAAVDERCEKSEEGSKVFSENILVRSTGFSDGGMKQAKQQGYFGVRQEHKPDITVKEEQGSQFNAVMVDEKQQYEQVAKMVEKRAEELVAKRIDPLLTGAEKVLSDMKRELCRVREENQNLQKARESMQKERQTFKRECEVMQVELQNLRDDVDLFRKENDVKVEKCCQKVAKLLKEEADIKAQMEDLRTLHRESRKKASNEEGPLASNAVVEALAKEQEHIAGRLLVGEREKAMIMDRVEHLSQLYLGGLENVRAEVTRLKRNAEASPSLGGKSLVADMRSRRERCLQLEAAMKDAVEEAVKLRDKYTLELEKAKEKWSWTMNLQAGEVNVILGNLKASFIELTGRLEGAESALHARIQRVEENISQLMTTSKQATAPDDGPILANVEKHQGVMAKELRRLDEQMQGMVEKLEQARHCFEEDKLVSLRQDVDTLGQKLRDATKSRTLIMDKMSEMGRKVRKLEGAQFDLGCSVEEVRACTKDLEKSVTSLYPKYEKTTSLLKGMDVRLVAAEDSLKEIRKPDCNCVRDSKQIGKPLSGGLTCEVDVQLLHTRVETLEGRVEHVASATFTNLRILDSKVEHYRAGVQSAVEGAAMAESKCGVLGAEIVKVFRALASRNEARDPNSKPARRSCRYCRKLSREAGADGAEINHLTALEASQPQEIEPPAEAATRRKREGGRNKTRGTEKLTFIESYAESFYESGRDFKKSMSRSIGQQRLAAGKTSKRKDNSNSNSNSNNKNKADTRTLNVRT